MNQIFPDGRSLLSALLFDIRGCLGAIKSYSLPILDAPTLYPPGISSWLSKNNNVFENWWRAEQYTRHYCQSAETQEPVWEDVIAGFASELSSVPKVYMAAQSLLKLSEADTQTNFVFLVKALSRLNEFYLLLVTEEYKLSWAKYT